MTESKSVRRPGWWVPTSYIAEGIPFAMVIWVSATMFKDLGYTDSQITLSTASIGIVWSLKPFWAAFLDMYMTKKFWVIAMECFMAALLALAAAALRLPGYFPVIIAVLWVLGFASATQDICVDGVYITELTESKQAAWIGVQGVSWNVGRILAQAVVVLFASVMKDFFHDIKTGWMCGLGLSAVIMGAFGVYHAFMLPTGTVGRRPTGAAEVLSTFGDTVKAFFQKKAIWGMLAFVFLYRTGEGFLLVEAPLFLQASADAGGAGLSLMHKALIDGTVSTVVSLIGGLLGGVFAARLGLRRSLLILALCMNIPHLCYVFLSYSVSPGHPLSLTTILILVSIEKFGYSFGFVGNMLYMMQQIAPGKYKMTHYAFCTSLMNLVLTPTQMLSGPVADWLGYRHFFVFVLVASIPSVIAAWKAPFPIDEKKAAAEDDSVPPAAVPADSAAL